MGVKQNLSYIFKCFKLNLQKEAQYKVSFVMQIVLMIINNVFLLLQWVIIFQFTDSIGGYKFNDVIMLWGFTAANYGVAHLFFAGAFDIGNLIYEGKLDVYLTQPKNVLINISCSRTLVSAFGDVIYCYIALIIAGATWWWYLAAIPIMIVGGLIFTGIVVCFETLAFFVKKGNLVADMIASAITQFGGYPSVIFDLFSRIILFTIVPCGFMVFIPIQYVFLSFNIWWILGAVGFTILIIILAFGLFKLGLKKYSSGNLMNGRI